MRKYIVVISYLLLAGVLYFCKQADHALDFSRGMLDRNGKGRTAIGDLNGDGYNDVVLHQWGSDRGKISDGQLVLYLYPDWRKVIIRDSANFFGDAVVIADIDGDGALDIVTSRGNDNSAQVWWYKNPGDPENSSWSEFFLAEIEKSSEVKNIEVHDMDHNGRSDVVVRTKHFTSVLYQDSVSGWSITKMVTPEREGMALGDLDMDGYDDVVLNGFWLHNPGKPQRESWKRYDIDTLWFTDYTGGWQDFSVMVVVSDINNDEKNDVVFSHPEKTGFSIAWYESDNPMGGITRWEKHEVGVVDYCHSLQAADIDLDGDIDIIAGTLNRSENPELLLFTNLNESGLNWARTVIDTLPVYKAALGDIDNDGDLDITSSYNWDTGPVYLWRNTYYHSE